MRPEDAPKHIELGKLVVRIADGDQEAEAEFYKRTNRGVTYLAIHRLGKMQSTQCCQFEDVSQDVYAAIFQAIRRGDVRDPQRIVGYLRIITIRTCCQYIADAAIDRRYIDHRQRDPIELEQVAGMDKPTPERVAMNDEKWRIAMRTLESMSNKEQDILRSFYLNSESQESIMARLNMTETQFRLAKSRAKDKFGRRGQAWLKMPELITSVKRRRRNLLNKLREEIAA
jgi:RNA polymerase sigma factor (sigma-70 family)